MTCIKEAFDQPTTDLDTSVSTDVTPNATHLARADCLERQEGAEDAKPVSTALARANVPPLCPAHPEHGPLEQRPLEEQTNEQRWCGEWWDCPEPGCRAGVLFESPELIAQREAQREAKERPIREKACSMKMIITIEGGCLRQVFAENPTALEVTVIDFDNQDSQANSTQAPQLDGLTHTAEIESVLVEPIPDSFKDWLAGQRP